MHGHDMSCLAHIPNSSCYVSGAEEKVLRVFQAPQTFDQTLALAQGRSAPSTDPSPQGRQVLLTPALLLQAVACDLGLPLSRLLLSDHFCSLLAMPGTSIHKCFRNCFATTLQLLCNCFGTSSQLLCNCFATACILKERS